MGETLIIMRPTPVTACLDSRLGPSFTDARWQSEIDFMPRPANNRLQRTAASRPAAEPGR